MGNTYRRRLRASFEPQPPVKAHQPQFVLHVDFTSAKQEKRGGRKYGTIAHEHAVRFYFLVKR